MPPRRRESLLTPQEFEFWLGGCFVIVFTNTFALRLRHALRTLTP